MPLEASRRKLILEHAIASMDSVTDAPVASPIILNQEAP